MPIHIPVPCHKDWSNMSQCDKGRYCAACNKEVVDFAQLNDIEALNRLTTGNRFCGRISGNRLNGLNILMPLFVAGAAIPTHLHAQALSEKEPGGIAKSSIADNKSINDTINIYGTVTDNNTKEPIIAANVAVYIYGSKEPIAVALTDIDGKYQIRLSKTRLAPSFDVKISSLGYETRIVKELKVTKKGYYMPLKMTEMEHHLMGDIIVIKDANTNGNENVMKFNRDGIDYLVR